MLQKQNVADFIRANLRLTPVPSIPEIRLYTAHPASGLRQLVTEDHNDDPPAPYWAYPWSGGAALARYFLDRPETVRGRRVLDLGAGGGVVAIAAAMSGASEVTAAEIDPNGAAALGLNAAANEVGITVINEVLTKGPAPHTDLIAVGDLFYAPELAAGITAYLDRCVAAGIDVLVGDPGRADLPRSRLTLLAEYQVPEVGATRGTAGTPSAVYAFRRKP
jgi:predicted nicotinamide N-methyase